MSADIYKEIADNFYRQADLFQRLAESVDGPERPSRPAAAVPKAAPASFDSPEYEASPFDELPATADPTGPQGFEGQCPKHRREYKDGRYGPYCTAQSDDPAWANKRGYCNISPKNAHVWLRHQAAA